MELNAPLVIDIKVNPSSMFGESAKALDLAHAFMMIDSLDTCQIACDELQRVMGLKKKLDDEEATMLDPINKAHRAIKDHFRAPRRYLEQAEEILKNGILYFRREEERKRLAAQKAADEAAARERQRLADEAQAQRLAAESAAAQLRMEAEHAMRAGNEDAARTLIGKSVAVEEMGMIAARSLEESAHMMIAPTVPDTVPKVSGISARKHWTYEVTDAEKIPHEYWVLDEKKLSGVVRSMGGACSIPGIRVFQTESIASRSK